MILEIVGAVALAGLVLWLVFAPAGHSSAGPEVLEPEAPEETRRGIALLALKEIEFDRETGKLSDADYRMLQSRYAAEALAALAAEGPTGSDTGSGNPEELISARVRMLRSARSTGLPVPASCPSCGPRPEADALFCSHCGRALLDSGFCSGCGASLAPDGRFCANCGVPVAA